VILSASLPRNGKSAPRQRSSESICRNPNGSLSWLTVQKKEKVTEEPGSRKRLLAWKPVGATLAGQCNESRVAPICPSDTSKTREKTHRSFSPSRCPKTRRRDAGIQYILNQFVHGPEITLFRKLGAETSLVGLPGMSRPDIKCPSDQVVCYPQV
jgi:hypothetical protein